MAIPGGDGSIILDTKIDTSGIDSGLGNIKNKTKSADTVFKQLTDTIRTQEKQLQALKDKYSNLVLTQQQNSTEANKLEKEIKELSVALAENKTKLNDVKTASDNVAKGMKGASSRISSALAKLGSQLALVFSVSKIIAFSSEAGRMATQQEANVQRLIDIYGEASQSVGDFIDSNARALGMSRSAAAQFSAVYGNLFSVWADQATNAELTNQYLNMTAVVASKTGRTVEDVQERVRSGLLGNTEAIEDLGVFVNVKTIEMTEAFKRMAGGKSWEKLDAYTQQQIRTMAILEQATQKYGTEVAETTALTRAQYNAAYQDMQATWGRFVNAVLMPVLKVVTQIMNVITAGLRAIAGITGKTIESTEGVSSSIGGAVNNQNALTDATKKTAKEQKKLLAGFDDLQILSQNSSNGDGTNASSGGVKTEVLPNGDEGNGDLGTQKISAELTALMGFIGGVLAAIGVILMFNGQIAWGIGFIIGGASVFGVSMAALSQGDFVSPICTSLLLVMGIVGIALAAIGLFLLYKGSVKWGISFIIAGASAFGVSLVALTSGGNPSQEAANALLFLMGVIGGAMIALGIMLIILGSYAWGVGFIVAGVATLGVAAWAISKFDVNEVGTTLSLIAGIAAGAALAIGIMLAIFGGPALLPWAVGLIVVGAAGIAAVVAINSDAVVEMLRGKIGVITAIVSAALLVIGILLCVAQIWPLGIGLIAAGAVGLATVVTVNFDWLKEKISTIINAIVNWLKTWGLLVLGILLCFTGVGIPLGIALIKKAAGNLTEAQDPLWDTIVDKVKEIWGKIKEFWNEHIAKIFTKEWWLNLGKKVMNGLIAGFEKGINGIIGMFEKMINWIVNGLNKISFDVPDWVPGIGGKTFGFNIAPVTFDRVSIPRLARGTVIPPNREFLAVLGDQKHGTNIEAPLQTIVDAFNIALQGNAYTGGGNTEVVLEIDGREFGRAIVEQGNKENRRIGTRLVIV